MSLDTDIRIDRQNLKRRLAFWRVVAILAFLAILLMASSWLWEPALGPHIARIEVSGVIVDDRERDEVLKAVAENGRIKALLVRIDSPGGTVVGGEALYNALRRVAGQKPVVAVLDTIATSGGYMAAIAADHIVARKGTITGSIGVVFQTAEITTLLEKLGIETTAIKSAPLKAAPSPLEKLTPDVREATQALVNDMFELFIDMVVARRGLSQEEVRRLADGRVYTGRQALTERLIDALGGEAEALAWLSEARDVDPTLPIRDIEAHPERLFWRKTVDSLLGKRVFSERLTLDGLISLWHPERP
ncbi:MAG: signal peptide peptidase SppA [Alphaproteobacteria bacterium]|nr:signal peptide peptidase SppA [Alphaproteobacteria bacterium]